MDNQDPLRNPDNGKVLIVAPIPVGSLASIQTIHEIEAQIVENEKTLIDATVDPVGPALLNARTERVKRMQGVAMTADMFAVGDTVYHKKHKEEAVVRELGSDGRVRVKWGSGEKTWVKPANLVKL